MDKLFDTADLKQIYHDILVWTQTQALNLDSVVQSCAVAVTFLLAWRMSPTVRQGINWLGDLRGTESWLTVAGESLSVLALPFTWLVLQWILVLAADATGWPHYLLTITTSLLSAWIVIRLATSLIREPTLAKAVSIAAWSIAVMRTLFS